MRIAWIHIALGLAIGLIAGLTNYRSLRADEPVHAGGHDHAEHKHADKK